jgi:hypothetical protein
LHGKRLVRAFVVVDAPKAAEAELLRGERVRGRLGGLLLERPVHALVAAVLLRLAGGNALGPDAELDPPNRQPRQPARCDRGERRPVIRANRQRPPELAEGRLEDRPHVALVRATQAFAAQ